MTVASRRQEASLYGAVLFIGIPYALLRTIYADLVLLFWLVAWVVVQLPFALDTRLLASPEHSARIAALYASYSAPLRPEQRWLIRSIKAVLGKHAGRLVFVLVVGTFLDWFYRSVRDSAIVTIQSYRARQVRRVT